MAFPTAAVLGTGASLLTPIIGKPKGAPKQPAAMPQSTPAMLSSSSSQQAPLQFQKPQTQVTPQSFAEQRLKGGYG